MSKHTDRKKARDELEAAWTVVEAQTSSLVNNLTGELAARIFDHLPTMQETVESVMANRKIQSLSVEKRQLIERIKIADRRELDQIKGATNAA